MLALLPSYPPTYLSTYLSLHIQSNPPTQINAQRKKAGSGNRREREREREREKVKWDELSLLQREEGEEMADIYPLGGGV